MIIVGWILITLGIGWLIDFNAWPVVLIGAGVAYILTAVLRGGRGSAWALPACCYPEFWLGREPDRRQAPEDDPTQP